MSLRLPRHVPLDWHDPDIFNTYPARIRARYRTTGIALPAMHHWIGGRVPSKFKTMDDTEFMRDYGDEVLKMYNIPTQEEVGDDDIDDDDEPEEMDVDDEGEADA